MGYYQEILMGLEAGPAAGAGSESYRWYVSQLESTALEIHADKGAGKDIVNRIFDLLADCLRQLEEEPVDKGEGSIVKGEGPVVTSVVEAKKPLGFFAFFRHRAAFARELSAITGFRWFANKIEARCLERTGSDANRTVEILQATLRALIQLAPTSTDCRSSSDCYGYWVCCDGCCKPRCGRIF